MHEIFEKIENLSLDRSEPYRVDKFTGAFLEEDSTIINELFPLFVKSFGDKSFCSHVTSIYLARLEADKNRIEKEMLEKCEASTAYLWYKSQLDSILNKSKVRTFESLIKFIKGEFQEYTGNLEILNHVYQHIHDSCGENYISENYHLYYIGHILFEEFRNQREKLQFLNRHSASEVINEYNGIELDIKKLDIQFRKYSLLTLNEHIKICNDKDSQTIIDDRIGKYFWISVPKKLLSAIDELIQKEIITDISFRVSRITTKLPILEGMGFGSPLKVDLETLPKISKFYSCSEVENSLWVNHDKSKGSITFEETLSDFELSNEDIVTQVVHLEYKKIEEEYIISHLDHEYILYTLDQYLERIQSPKIKGYKKVKTFKIDDSKIPSNYKYNDAYFLLLVLESFFKNKDLLIEYFSEI